MSPRHQTSSGSWPPTSASTASSAGRLLWMSDMTATRTGDQILTYPSAGGRKLRAAWPAAEREFFQHLVGHAAAVAECAVEQEESAVAEHGGVDVVDPPPAPPDADVVDGGIEERDR